MKTVSVILPCYNEEAVLPLYFKAVDPIIKGVKDYSFEFILVNDGSKDNTLSVMKAIYDSRDDVTIVNLSRNFGQNPALTAGLTTSTADYVIMMDCDLQDPVRLIPEICAKFTDGYEVVSPHRACRETDTRFKRNTAAFFYRFTNSLEGKEVLPPNVNCFRGLSKRAVEKILALPEKDRLLVNEIPLVGFRTCLIDFEREKRLAGKSKYNIKKMVNYAFDIISSGTSKPLYEPVKFGAVLSVLFGIVFLVLLVFYLLGCTDVLLFDYPTLGIFLILSAVFFVGSILVFLIGILSLYVHNILINTRDRPTFCIDYVYSKDDKKKDE